MARLGVNLRNNNGDIIQPNPYYRVGDLFLTTNSQNPSSFLGGTWQLFGPGRTLVCVDTSQSEFNSVKKTGGKKNHKHLSPMTWVANPSVPGWGQFFGTTNSNDFEEVGYTRDFYGAEYTKHVTKEDTNWPRRLAYYTNEETSLQPFITCYVWIRTA